MMPDPVVTFKGKRLSEMTREELIGAVETLARLYSESVAPDEIEARSLGRIEMMRRHAKPD
jgi:hypothetical protein